MANFDKIVNKNDNHYMSWAGMVDKERALELVPFISKADELIKKHCKEWFKNHPGGWSYLFLQFQLCGELLRFNQGDKTVVSLMATLLQCPKDDLAADLL